MKNARVKTRKPARQKGLLLLASLLALVILAVAVHIRERLQTHAGSERLPLHSAPTTLSELLPTAMEKKGLDIALMNLLCAKDLPGTEDLNAAQCLATLDQWAQHVRTQTERHLYRFRTSPAEYEHSEAYFRMLMMAVVLYEDFGVRYNPERIAIPAASIPNDHFFADSRDILLHGLLGNRKMGTCSSMPVLYIAIGRRLGYPLKLATTKAHLFIRWEGGTDRFDLEATGKGMNRYTDEHFKQWPFPVSDEEIRTEGYLKSLTAAEELAVFLSLRAACLTEAGRLAEATVSFEAAYRLSPNWKRNHVLLAESQQRQKQQSLSTSQPVVQTAAKLPADPNPLQQIQTSKRNP